MAHKVKLAYPIILASGSPRRRELMLGAGYAFEVVRPEIEEPGAPAEGGGAAAGYWAESLAYIKAAAVALRYPEALVIGADTIVRHGETLVGKPRDLADARRILTNLFGGRNEVITGVALICAAARWRVVTHVVTELVMRPMDEAELEDYLASGAWRDKAGAYALQEGGDRFVQSISGSESNIVGLPMERLGELIGEFAREVGAGDDTGTVEPWGGQAETKENTAHTKPPSH